MPKQETALKIQSVFYKIMVLNTEEDFHLAALMGCLETAINMAWCKETCRPNYRKMWSRMRPARGQSDITAILIFNLFGGKILKDLHKDYCWNELPEEFEVSEEFKANFQFAREHLDSGSLIYADIAETPETLFEEAGANVRERYEIFEEKVIAFILSAYEIHD